MGFKGLEGVSVDILESEFFRRPDQISAILRKGKAAAAGGDFGALCIYKDDEGLIRCDMQRHFKKLSDEKFKTMREVRLWAKKWLKEIQ